MIVGILKVDIPIFVAAALLFKYQVLSRTLIKIAFGSRDFRVERLKCY